MTAADRKTALEAALINLASLIKSAPETERPALADKAFEYILHKCGTDPLAIFAHKLSRRDAKRGRAVDTIGETVGRA